MLVGEGVVDGEGVGEGVWVGFGVGLGVSLGVALGIGDDVGDETTTEGPMEWKSSKDGAGNDSGVWPSIAIVMKSCQISAGMVPP